MSKLVTRSEVEQHLDITAESNNNLINHLISKCSGMIESFCNRIFIEATYEELYKGDGTYELILDNCPIISITTLSLDIDKENQTYGDTISEAYYLLKKNSGIVEMYNDSFTKSSSYNVYIKYKAGYSQIPEDVQMIVLDLIAKKYYDTDEKRFGVDSKTILNQDITFNFTDLSDFNKKILKTYRKPPRNEGVDVSGRGWASA